MNQAPAATREHSPEYTAYIGSPAWARFRASYIARLGPLRCAACGSSRWVQLHHRHYRTLGHESLSDVTPLCKSCHQNVHNAARQSSSPLALATDRYVRRFLRAREARTTLPPATRQQMWQQRKVMVDRRPQKRTRPTAASEAALRQNARALGVEW